MHRIDMPIEKAMQDAARCQRIELLESQVNHVTLPPWSITRLQFTKISRGLAKADKGAAGFQQARSPTHSTAGVNTPIRHWNCP